MYSTTYFAEIVKVISSVAFVGASIYTLYKRWELGGINAFGIRKK